MGQDWTGYWIVCPGMPQLALTGSTPKGNDLGGTRLGVVYSALNRTGRRENPEGRAHPGPYGTICTYCTPRRYGVECTRATDTETSPFPCASCAPLGGCVTCQPRLVFGKDPALSDYLSLCAPPSLLFFRCSDLETVVRQIWWTN